MTLIATELIPSPNQSAAPNSIRRIAFLNVEGSAFARCSMSSSSPLLLSPSVVVAGASVAASQLSTGACEDDDDDVKAAAAAAAAVAAHAAALAPALCFCAAVLAAQAARKEAPHQLDGAGGAVGTLRGGATRFAVEVSLTGVATVILLAAPLARDGLQVVHTFVKLRSSARCVASIAGAAQGRPTCGECGEVIRCLCSSAGGKTRILTLTLTPTSWSHFVRLGIYTVTYISHHIHDEAAAPLSFALTRGTSSLVVVVVVVSSP